ncbi:MAG: RNA polymerase sigma factor [Labilithrix sp.]|nr:RNA polymerase sigma factor [Labilithrix sp.]
MHAAARALFSRPRNGRPQSGRVELGTREDGADFLELYEQYLPLVWRWAARLGVPRHSLDDAVQEVFLTLYGRLDDFEGRSSLKSWVFAVTFRVVRNFRRRRGSAPAGDDETEVDAIAAEGVHPEAAATQSEAVTLLQSILDGLDDDKREVFVMAELEGLTATEIGHLLGVSSNTVASRLRHAREEVRAAWERAKARDAWRLR